MNAEQTTDAHTTETATISTTARACAQGWAEQAREHTSRTWTGPVLDADIDFMEETLGRPMTHDETVEFCATFRDEYAACMAQKAEREGWSCAAA